MVAGRSQDSAWALYHLRLAIGYVAGGSEWLVDPALRAPLDEEFLRLRRAIHRLVPSPQLDADLRAWQQDNAVPADAIIRWEDEPPVAWGV